MVSLESLKMGTKAQISRIDGNAHFQSRIVSVGLIPGSHVEIILNQKKRPLLLYCRNTVLAIDREDCRQIQAEVMKRSMYMLADYIGIKLPTILILNMMDVAKQQGKQIDVKALEKELHIPVLPFVAADKSQYKPFYELLQRKDKEKWILNEHLLENFYCID